jgi:hypothetical protein
MKSKLQVGILTAMSVAVLGVWQFPQFWYVRSDPQMRRIWFSGGTNVVNWTFQAIPVDKTAEATLAADKLFSGQFTNAAGQTVQVFSAKRYSEHPNEIGLFMHTPDRCWTESGWKIEPVLPDHLELEVHGMQVAFERRVFVFGSHRELVYFGGMVGGQPLPYRLDHNMSVGMKHQLGKALDKTGTAYRAIDKRLWGRVWDSFVSRRPLIGPKQFLRLSTPLRGFDPETSDRLLQSFMQEWLIPTDYQTELAQAQQAK